MVWSGGRQHPRILISAWSTNWLMAFFAQRRIDNMLIRFHLLVVLGFTSLGVLFAAPPSAAQQAASDKSSAQKIAHWIEQLDADQFVTRRAATDNLIAAGRAAIAPLGKVLRNSNLEVATRGIFVLRQLAICGDVATEEAATTCLEQLASLQSNASARLAR